MLAEECAEQRDDPRSEPEGEQGQRKETDESAGEDRGEKILVFHYKRKKQYKKLNGHRQPFTAVKITGISVDGQELKA